MKTVEILALREKSQDDAERLLSSVGRLLKKRREVLGLGIPDVAELAGLTRSGVARIEQCDQFDCAVSCIASYCRSVGTDIFSVLAEAIGDKNRMDA